ncbi:uncharacterized protein LOC131687020 [Topomyia yanbarensis]|uniref:uncharacterized protein LOC131687020 n=1 Tax=Topomyia yanbarensis TaxID=2498891 RepID=UPI00273B761B|nr:uncharacterized protein LOC131687020 [Topomyia yanbarensis]
MIGHDVRLEYVDVTRVQSMRLPEQPVEMHIATGSRFDDACAREEMMVPPDNDFRGEIVSKEPLGLDVSSDDGQDDESSDPDCSQKHRAQYAETCILEGENRIGIMVKDTDFVNEPCAPMVYVPEKSARVRIANEPLRDVSNARQEMTIPQTSKRQVVSSANKVPCGNNVSSDDDQELTLLESFDPERAHKVHTRSGTKKKKAVQKYMKDWELKLHWLAPGSNQYSKCSAGFVDFQKHGTTQKHKQNESLLKKATPSVTTMLKTSYKEKIRNAELQLCAWGAANDKSASDIESFAECIRRICPDSEIAKGLKMGRTKATAIITNVLGEGQHDELSAHLKKTPFSLIADESTDLAAKKSLALIVRTFFWRKAKLVVADCFYDLIQVIETDSRTLHTIVTDCFKRDHIDYQSNLLGYAADGANNMTGTEKSLATFLKKDCPSLFVLKCICHSMALCSSYACKHVPDRIEQVCRDIYNYLSCSPLRTSKFDDIQILLELKPMKMLHPSATRWLSLESVVQRILDRFEALKIYFGFLTNVDQVEKIKVVSIYETLNDPVTKLYLTFLAYILNLVNKLNKLFLSETPELLILNSSVSRLFRTILDCFFKSDYMQKLNDLTKVSNRSISVDQVNHFRTNIMRFYITLSNQILKRFNFNDGILVNLTIINPDNIISRKHTSLLPLLQCFPNVISCDQIQTIDDEYREVRNINFSEFSNDQLKDPTAFWEKVLTMERCDGQLAFPALKVFIPCMLILPHSSASVERLFSAYNLNKTKLRNRLETETMRGILATKSYVRHNKDASGE